MAPRLGAVFDLSGDGKTVVKGDYGFFWHNPGVAVGSNANPNTRQAADLPWNDRNADRRWQPGEQGDLLSQALQGGVELDPDIKAPYTHEASVWLERQLAKTVGVRGGFVYKTEDDLIATDYQPLRVDGYTVPFTYVDIGLDGRRGTGDDRNLPMLGLPSAQAANFPATTVVQNVPRFSRYKTIELSLNKRYSRRWSMGIGSAHTWMTDFPNGFPLIPISLVPRIGPSGISKRPRATTRPLESGCRQSCGISPGATSRGRCRSPLPPVSSPPGRRTRSR